MALPMPPILSDSLSLFPSVLTLSRLLLNPKVRDCKDVMEMHILWGSPRGSVTSNFYYLELYYLSLGFWQYMLRLTLCSDMHEGGWKLSIQLVSHTKYFSKFFCLFLSPRTVFFHMRPTIEREKSEANSATVSDAGEWWVLIRAILRGVLVLFALFISSHRGKRILPDS